MMSKMAGISAVVNQCCMCMCVSQCGVCEVCVRVCVPCMCVCVCIDTGTSLSSSWRTIEKWPFMFGGSMLTQWGRCTILTSKSMPAN